MGQLDQVGLSQTFCKHNKHRHFVKTVQVLVTEFALSQQVRTPKVKQAGRSSDCSITSELPTHPSRFSAILIRVISLLNLSCYIFFSISVLPKSQNKRKKLKNNGRNPCTAFCEFYGG